MRRRRLAVALAALGAAATLAACNGGSDSQQSVTGPGEQFAVVTEVSTSAVPTTTVAAGAAGPLRPVSASASATAPPGVDGAGNRIDYGAGNLTDGNPTTAWRVAGDGRGVVITLRFDRPVVVTNVALIPGYAKVDAADGADRFGQNRRVVRARVAFDDGDQEVRLEDRRDLQRFDVGSHTTAQVIVEILETTANPDRDFTAISEIELTGTPAA